MFCCAVNPFSKGVLLTCISTLMDPRLLRKAEFLGGIGRDVGFTGETCSCACKTDETKLLATAANTRSAY
jgi:hypothetical protein